MIFMPPKHIIEKYLKPNGLSEHLIDEIPCSHYVGPGLTIPIFSKPVVERFVEERRPKSLDKKSYGEEEGLKVVAANVIEVLEKIARALEKLVTVVVPDTAPPVPEPDKGDRVYSVRQAAAAIGLKEWTVRKYCRDGVFGRELGNGRYVILKGEIDAYLNRQRTVHGRGVA